VFDVAIVGAGAAGCELAYRLSEAQRAVALVTTSLDTVYTSERPHVSPGELVGRVAEAALAPHPRQDRLSRWELHATVKQVLEQGTTVHLLQSSVEGLRATEQGWSVETWEGVPIHARRVVLAVGTFLNPEMQVGTTQQQAGRLGEMAYPDLHAALVRQGIDFTRAEDQGESDDGLPWTRRYWTLATAPETHFKVSGLPGVYAIGRCRRECQGYEASVQDAELLAQYFLQLG
jgi:tRNA U34 5-carboxymethylaminomethyl modifying enzyme MnmG/GidA